MSWIDIDSLAPAGKFVLVRKCAVGDELADGKRGVLDENGKELLVFDDIYSDTTEFVQVAAVGPDCKIIEHEHIGMVFKCAEIHEDLHGVDNSGEWWMVPEDGILPVAFLENGSLLPLADWVALEADQSLEESKGGICIREVDQMHSEVATVLCVGPGRISKKGIRLPPQVEAGNKVMISRGDYGYGIDYQNKHIVLAKESSILGIL